MKRILLYTMLLTVLTGFRAYSQSRLIHGRVTAAENGLAIPGASVIIKGTNTGTQTNANGIYSINVPTGFTTLKFAFVGYQTQEIAIGKSDSVNVVLKANSTQLNEVVVIGYGVQRRVSLTGSATTVLNNTPSVQVVNDYGNQASKTFGSLQGQAKGVAVVNGITAKTPGMQVTQYAPKAMADKMVLVSPPVPNGYYATDINDESYKKIQDNKFLNPLTEPLSTFSADVDNAGYSNVRRFINNGQLPPPDAVRIEEMVNYFKYNMDGPKDKEPVAIHTNLAVAPWNTNHQLLRIGLKARTIPADKLPASNLVFLIDVSGSMFEPNKLPLVKSSVKMLVEQLRAKDNVAIVVYAGNAGLVLPSTPGDQKSKIDAAIDGLEAGGSTNGGEGIKLAYKIARENFKKDGNNRIMLATDGDFNVGASSDEDIETLITKERDSKVFLSILGFGMGNYKDSKMETLADKGNGNYFYIDNITEAHKALVSEFSGTLFTVAKDVKIQVEFNPAKVQAYRLLGYEDRMLNKEDFNNDKKDAGDMGSGHVVTAFYEIIPTGVKNEYADSADKLKYQANAAPQKPAGPASDEVATVKFRYKQPDADVSKMSLVTVKGDAQAFNKAPDDFRFAAAVAELGLVLRNSEFKGKADFDQLIKIAKGARGNDADGYRAEFVRLAESARSLAGGRAITENNSEDDK